MKETTSQTLFEQAANCLSIGNYRRAAEAMLQIIMEQQKEIAQLREAIIEPKEVNFTDGLDEDDNF